MRQSKKFYTVIELTTGRRGIRLYSRETALEVVHQLNKKNTDRRYAICAV